MVRQPVVVGINRTQDGSIAVAAGTSRLYSLQKERITRRKHHWGRLGDLPEHYVPRLPLLREPVDLVVEGFSSDDELGRLEEYRAELRETLDLTEDARVVLVSHHLSHLYSAFPPSPFDRAAGLVVDAQGSRVRDLTEDARLPEGTGGDLLEIGSFYRCRRGRRPECIAKQLWDGDWARPAGLGCFYSLLTRALWPEGEGNEGKVMGLAPFGDPKALDLPELTVTGPEVFIPEGWLAFLTGEDRRYLPGDPARFPACADLAAAGQQVFENALMQLADWLHGQTGEENLVFAGGTALNCSANGRLLDGPAFRDVFIPPGPHDGGTAVGCAIYGLVECLGVGSGFRWEDDFLGPEPEPARIEDALRAVGSHAAGSHAADGEAELVVERPDDLVAAVVDLLETGRVVGLHSGRSESGPRALGNRSILADPRRPDMQAYINDEVKGREWFRPLAPLVLAEHAERIFAVRRPAPFMQYAADVRPEFRADLPGITHVDGTARLQTVEPVHTPFLHALLTAWFERTGSPVLVNTSLNGPGDPLTEAPEDSLETLRRTGMHALAMPPYLLRKRAERPGPARR